MSYELVDQNQADRACGPDGGGKTCIGRRLARRLQMSFVDADEEIVKAAGAPVAEIFRRYGESAFRESERRVIARLLNAPLVLATGGGAFMDTGTRDLIKQRGISSGCAPTSTCWTSGPEAGEDGRYWRRTIPRYPRRLDGGSPSDLRASRHRRRQSRRSARKDHRSRAGGGSRLSVRLRRERRA